MENFDELFNRFFNDPFFSDFFSKKRGFSSEFSSDMNLPQDENYKKEEGNTDGVKWKKETWSDENGSYMMRTYTTYNSEETPVERQEIDIESLKAHLEKAVSEERYEDAAKIRDQIKDIE